MMWQIYLRYHELLDGQGLCDWSDLARLMLKHSQPMPQYDVVIIDEARDLPPSVPHMATKLLPDYRQGRSLTLLADPAQSIYYRGIPWREAGINISGRTRILEKNYRNTQQILEAASCVLAECEDLKAEDEYIRPTSTERHGPKPALVAYESSASSNRFVVNRIVELCQSGLYRPGDIALLSRNRALYRYLLEAFEQASLPLTLFRDDAFHILENSVKFITMHSAKGLELPVVFMLGLDDRYVPYINPASETREADELQERKLFYVAMTRASEQLYLMRPKRDRRRFLRDLDPRAVRELRC